MHRRWGIIILMLGLCQGVQSQHVSLPPVEVQTCTLSNGMKVVVAEDHATPTISGGIIVHAGSYNDPPQYTGTAYYLARLLLRGTDSIGTTQWSKEKPYLDSIANQYDELRGTTNVKERKEILDNINRLSIAAAQYVIPNELEAILSQMGCSPITVNTSYEYTLLRNTLPSWQLSKWMNVYAEMLRYPALRSVQTELNTIIEEKQHQEDAPYYLFSQLVEHESYGTYPYANEISGSIEHLNNPDLRAARKFFDTYYVANNMTLVLVGDITLEKAQQLAEVYFGELPQHKLPEPPRRNPYKLPPFNANYITAAPLTPLKTGAMIFAGTPLNHEDNLVLYMVTQMLSNGSTGLLDRLCSQQQVLSADFKTYSYNNAGVHVVKYQNLLAHQQFDEAEYLILDQIDSICQGHFSPQLLEAVKGTELYRRARQLEHPDSVFNLMVQLDTQHKTFAEWKEESDSIANLCSRDIWWVAARHFDRRYYTAIRSKNTILKKVAADQYTCQALPACNMDRKSEFAKQIERQTPVPSDPQRLIYDHDVRIEPINNRFNLYYTNNPYNDIFELKIHFNYGIMNDANLQRAVDYFTTLGTKQASFEEFRMKVQAMGGCCTLKCEGDQYTTIHLSGYEKDLDTLLVLCNQFMHHPQSDPLKMQRITMDETARQKGFRFDMELWDDAIYQYAAYGSLSNHLRPKDIKQWSRTTNAQLLVEEVQEAFRHDGYVTFTGNTLPAQLQKKLRQYQLVLDGAIPGVQTPRQLYQYTRPTIYVAPNKHMRHCDMHLFVHSPQPTTEPMTQLFEEYLGLTQHADLGELHALGYNIAGHISRDAAQNDVALNYQASTSYRRALDVIALISANADSLTRRPAKFNTAKRSLLTYTNSHYITFRDMPAMVHQWSEAGYDHDPRGEYAEEIKSATYDDMMQVYSQYLQGHPVVITITGHTRQIRNRQLAPYGKVRKLQPTVFLPF